MSIDSYGGDGTQKQTNNDSCLRLRMNMKTTRVKMRNNKQNINKMLDSDMMVDGIMTMEIWGQGVGKRWLMKRTVIQ